MDEIKYKLNDFEGPLDLLLTLIQKNKVSIEDIPISLICDQYMEYLNEAKTLNMDIATEFLVMASELMLIKSKMLLPKVKEDEEDPRAALADALIKYSQAKEAAKKMALLYPKFSGRMEKDTDEISIDKAFVADQEVESLTAAVRRIITYNENRPKPEKNIFTPMISSPIVPVEVKITGILSKMEREKRSYKINELLSDAVSLPDLIAIFLGILELIKVRRINLIEDENNISSVFGEDACLEINYGYTPDQEYESNEFDEVTLNE